MSTQVIPQMRRLPLIEILLSLSTDIATCFGVLLQVSRKRTASGRDLRLAQPAGAF